MDLAAAVREPDCSSLNLLPPEAVTNGGGLEPAAAMQVACNVENLLICSCLPVRRVSALAASVAAA